VLYRRKAIGRGPLEVARRPASGLEKDFKMTPQHKATMSALMSAMNKKRWTSPANRKAQSKLFKKKWKNPDYRQRQVELLSYNSKTILTIHGHKTGKASKTYRSWQNMLARCYDPKNNSFRYYGKRGIAVCKHWLEFGNFLADMGVRPVGKTLDRKNTDGNYTKRNCRWATKEQQYQSRRSTKLTPSDRRKIVQQYGILNQYQLAAKFGVSQGHIHYILKKEKK
jgi:mRNA-degrading endonuclease HigB of HigAB toxin-antitoxin module